MRSYFIKRHTCMSVTLCKAHFGQIGAFVRLAIEKSGNFNFETFIVEIANGFQR